MTSVVLGQSALIFDGQTSPSNVPPPPIHIAFESASASVTVNVTTQKKPQAIEDSFKFVRKLKYRVTAEDISIVEARCKANRVEIGLPEVNEPEVQSSKPNSHWTTDDDHLSVGIDH